MPYGIRKYKGCYKVFNKKTKKIFSKCTTKDLANKQIRLLRAIEYNKNFIPRSTNRTRKNRSRKNI